MKGDITLKILQAVMESAGTVSDIFEAILQAGYGASYSKLNYELSKLERRRASTELQQEERKRLRDRYYSLLYKLRRDNLIQESGAGNNRLSLTAKGKRILQRLLKRNSDKLPPNTYSKESGDRWVVVSFDIPESQKRKRDWLRHALRNIGLSMIHKSVWMGKAKIPKSLLNDLARLRILDFVERFEVSKGGSLKHLT